MPRLILKNNDNIEYINNQITNISYFYGYEALTNIHQQNNDFIMEIILIETDMSHCVNDQYMYMIEEIYNIEKDLLP